LKKNMPNPSIQSICVYCGSADGLSRTYLDAAADMGKLLAQSGIRLIYGAGKTGLMGAVADGALKAGGQVTGVVPENLNSPVLIHSGLTRLEVTADIHQRKARMSVLADAFIALPGGYGTFEELFETLTWAQIGIHAKPIGLLNIASYFDPLIHMVNHAQTEGFLFPEHVKLFCAASEPESLLQMMLNFKTPQGLDRWVNR
jgi:uncharacterized protein (TIGR00730 family)